MNFHKLLLMTVISMTAFFQYYSSYATETEVGLLSQVPLFIDRGSTIKIENNIEEVTPNIMLLFDNSGSMSYCIDSNRSCRYTEEKQRLTHLKRAAKALITALINRTDGLPAVNIGLSRFDGRDTITDILVPISPIQSNIATQTTTTVSRQKYSCKKRKRSRRVKCYKSGTPEETSETTETTYNFSDYLIDQIDSMKAAGSTPLAESLTQMGRYFAIGANADITIHPNSDDEKTVKVTDFFKRTPEVVSFGEDESGDEYTTSGDPNLRYNRSYQWTRFITTTSTDIVTLWESFAGLPAISMKKAIEAVNQNNGIETAQCKTTVKIPPQNHVILLTDGDSTYDYRLSPQLLTNYTGTGNTSKKYIIDVAKALHDIDFRPGNETENQGIQNIISHFVAFGDGVGSPTILQSAAKAGGGEFHEATNSAELLESFKTIINATKAEVLSGAARSAAYYNGHVISPNDSKQAYQVVFDTDPWKGDILAYNIKSDGSVDTSKLLWKVSDPSNQRQNRKLLTYNKNISQGVTFNYDNLDNTQKSDIIRMAPSALSDSDKKQFSVNFIKSTKLGDIIHSEAVFVPTDPLNKDIGVIYVGANDGMLHAFSTISGKELFAYIPNGLFSTEQFKGLNALSDSKNHRYYVDMTPTIQKLGQKTILTGGLGAGGKSIYALDVSSPDWMQAKHVLWEFSHQDMGFSFSKPKLAVLKNNTEVAIFGNGFPENINSPQPSKLFVVNATTGQKISEISNLGKGLSSTELVDMNNDGKIDRVYAGDLQGNLWVIDPNNGVSKKLFNANNQPITTKPVVLGHPKGGVMVLFGTGKYHWNGDESNKTTQAFYAIRDKSVTVKDVKTITKAKLFNVTLTTINEYRLSNGKTIDYDAYAGWTINFTDKGSSEFSGSERLVADPVVMGGKNVFFATAIPINDSACTRGGCSWLMYVDAFTGGATDLAFDINRDKVFTDSDLVNGSIPSGLKVCQGIPTRFRFQLTAPAKITANVTISDGSIVSLLMLSNKAQAKRYTWRKTF